MSVSPAPWRKILSGLPPETTQALVVAPAPDAPFFVATLSAMERQKGRWRRARGPFRAVIGRAGFAAPGEKREGDKKTPSGIFPLEHAFGYAEKAATRMAYRPIRDKDVWVDDRESPDYNRWSEKGLAGGASFETMKREDGLYRCGVVIGYNRDPVEKGRGSAIFLHVWKAPDAATSGCVAVSAGDLLVILAWLDPSRRPVVVLAGERA